MKNKTINTVIILGVLSLISILIIQLFWINKTIEVQKTSLAIQRKEDSLSLKDFKDNVHLALMTSLSKIQKTQTTNLDLYGAVKEIKNNHYTVDFNEELEPFYLETLLKKSFYLNNIHLDFYYGIYDCFTDSIVLSHRIRYQKDSIYVTDPNPAKDVTIQTLNLKKDGHYFTVYFPEQKIRSIKGEQNYSPWIYLTAMLILVLVFFGFSLTIILRQDRLSSIKNDFINNMTHELKTPISTISLSAEMLMRLKEVNKEQIDKYAGIIFKENKRLEQQVERVLNVAKLDKDQVILTLEDVDVNEIIKDVKESFELHHLDKGGSIDITLNAATYHVKADLIHLTNVVYNLLDNAVKYCETIPKVKIQTRNEKNGLWIEVTDNGIGMKKEDIPLIYEKFYRVPTGNLHNVKGFGLGLYYVKLIVDAHQGKILVKSEPKVGTTFSLFFSLT